MELSSEFVGATRIIPCNGDVLRELDRARTRSLGSIDSIGWLLSITVGRIARDRGVAVPAANWLRSL